MNNYVIEFDSGCKEEKIYSVFVLQQLNNDGSVTKLQCYKDFNTNEIVEKVKTIAKKLNATILCNKTDMELFRLED